MREGKPKRIGIFGCYWVHNFGDDLMALLCAQAFQQQGHEVSVFGLSGYDEAAGVKQVSDIGAFLDASDVVVIGGGGFLVPRPVQTEFQLTMERHCQVLAEGLRARRIPFYALSIGGTGQDVKASDLPPGWQALLGQARGITVRNEADVPLAKQMCEHVRYAPDMVWLAPTLMDFEPQSPPGLRRRLALNVAATSARREKANPRVVWLKRLLPHFRVTEVPASVNENPAQSDYQGLRDILENLHGCDVIVSSKLHLGLTALSFGNSFVSFNGPAKTRALMKQIDLDAFCGSSIVSLLSKLTQTYFRPGSTALSPAQLRELQDQARNHFEFFFEMVADLAPAEPAG